MADKYDDYDGGGNGGGVYLKTGDVIDALAVLFEPVSFQEKVPGRYGDRDLASGRVTLFFNEDQLNGKEGPVAHDIAFFQKTLASDVKRNATLGKVDKIIIARVVMQPNKDPNKYDFPVFRPVDDAVADKVKAYARARDAAANADPDWA